MNDIQMLQFVLRTRLMPFIEKCFKTLNPGTEFIQGDYIRAIAYQLELAAQGKNRRLVISLPPRHLKSISTSVAFTVWKLGQDPTLIPASILFRPEITFCWTSSPTGASMGHRVRGELKRNLPRSPGP